MWRMWHKTKASSLRTSTYARSTPTSVLRLPLTSCKPYHLWKISTTREGPMVGQTISRYKILEKLGQGGVS